MIRLHFILAFCGAAAFANAGAVPQERARAAANGFVWSDPVGSRLLPNHTASTAEARGAVWIVHLLPHGHIVVAGNDTCEPIIAFSDRDFVEPAPGSPFAAVLEGASVGCTDAKCSSTPSLQSVAPTSSPRAARWDRLTEGASRQGLSTPSSSATIVAPFLSTHWRQWQPYNDFSPQYNPSDTGSYRGRTSCGCVAVTAAQMMYHWRWPVRLDGTFSSTHKFYTDNVHAENFLLRFDGHRPLDWTSLAESYEDYQFEDMRGKLAESSRFPIARLVLLCDVLSGMYFRSDGSGADFATFANNAVDWYTPVTTVDPRSSPGEAATAMKADLLAGRPIVVTIPGHAVIGHGWADDGGTRYVYVNYGWGGNNDGWYNLDDSTSGNRILDATVGFVPRRKVQLDPLPSVSDTSVTLSWHLPPCYANAVSGFSVQAMKRASTTSTVAEDFSSPSGEVSSHGFSVGTVNGVGNSTPLLKVKPLTTGTYTFGLPVTLTCRSMLTYRVFSHFAFGQAITLQARFNGGDWTDISKPTLSDDYMTSGWKTHSVFLGEHGGEYAEIRVRASLTSDEYFETDYYALLDDITLADVLANIPATFHDADADARSFTISDLDPGETYLFTVTPHLDDAEAPMPVTTSIAGTIRTPQAESYTYQIQQLAYKSTSPDPAWSINGTSSNTTITTGTRNGGFSLDIPGELTSTSTLSFQWQVKGCHEQATDYDVFGAVFTDTSGKATRIWSIPKNQSNKTTWQSVSLSLAAFAGKSGELDVTFSHVGSQYTSAKNAYAKFSVPSVSNVRVGILSPEISWTETSRSTQAPPQILVLSSPVPAFQEGFYREAAIGSNYFAVVCSESVVALAAYPSHPSLVRDGDVVVHPLGGGRFTVEVNPTGIKAARANRSRMILTLAATDGNGTKTYKDIVLRFSTETKPQIYADPDAPIPYTIKFNPNGGEGQMPDQSALYGEVCELPANLFHRDGYSFAGWRQDGETEETPFLDRGVVSNLANKANAVVDLHAVWTANTYTVVFDPNGGAGTMAPKACVYDRSLKLDACTFTHGEDGFRGWALTPDGDVQFADEAEVTNLTKEENGEVVFYAKWDDGLLWAETGEYVQWTLAELGFDVPTDGSAYTVTALGLPSGLKLVKSPAVTHQVKDRKTGRKKTVIDIPAGTNWWIEGVATTAPNFLTSPCYLTVTAGGTTYTSAIPLRLFRQNVADLGEIPMGVAVKRAHWLPGVTNGWTVSGLPTGLKYSGDRPVVTKKLVNAKKKLYSITTNVHAHTVYGTPAKAGIFSMTAKKKTNGFHETLKFRVLVTPRPVNTTFFGNSLTNLTSTAYEPVSWNLLNGAIGDGAPTLPVVGTCAKVSGLPTGLTFATHAVYGYTNAKKKTGRYLKQSAQTIVGTPKESGTYVVTFTKNVKSGKKTVAKTAQVLWKVVANPKKPTLAFNESGGTVLEGNVGVTTAGLAAFAAGEGATVTASGLPKGVTLVRLGNGTWGFKGFTTKAGVYLVTVKATLNGNTVTQRLALRVAALPAWARGTFDGGVSKAGRRETENAAMDENGECAEELSGAVRLSVSSTGTISGTLREHGTNWTLNASSYTGSACDEATGVCTNYSCTNVLAKYTHSAKSGEKTVKKTLTRKFSISVSGDILLGTRTCASIIGTELASQLSTPSILSTYQNEWSGAYKAIGASLFTMSKKVLYHTYRYTSADLPEVLADGETISLKITPAGVVTATCAHPTGKTDKKTRRAIVYKPTWSTTLIPTTPSSAGPEGFRGDVNLYFPASPANGFDERILVLERSDW